MLIQFAYELSKAEGKVIPTVCVCSALVLNSLPFCSQGRNAGKASLRLGILVVSFLLDCRVGGNSQDETRSIVDSRSVQDDFNQD
jgi:hypothetical protein